MKFHATKLVASVALLFTLGAAGCGDEAPADENTQTETTFACLNIECDTANGEFCLYEVYAATDEKHAATCVAPATACTSCDCAEDAAVDYFDGGNNCGGWIACSQQNDAITIECKNPMM